MCPTWRLLQGARDTVRVELVGEGSWAWFLVPVRWGLRGSEGAWGGSPGREGGLRLPRWEHSSAEALGDRDRRYQEAGRSPYSLPGFLPPCGPHTLTTGGCRVDLKVEKA